MKEFNDDDLDINLDDLEKSIDESGESRVGRRRARSLSDKSNGVSDEGSSSYSSYDGEKELDRLVELNSNKKDVKIEGNKFKKVVYVFILLGFILLSIIGVLVYLLLNKTEDTVQKVDVVDKIVEDEIVGDEIIGDIEGSKELSIDVEGTNIEADNNFINRSSVYDSDLLTENVIFRMGLISEEGLSIPVSFIISKDKLKEDFGTTEVKQYDMYMRYGSSLSEEYLGFVDYHPYKGILSVDEETSTMIFRFDDLSSKLYDTGTASTEIFKNSLIDTFGMDYVNLRFEDSEGDYYYFNHEGEVEDAGIVFQDVIGYGYYRYVLENGNEFLGTNFGMFYETVGEALISMKTPGNDMYESLIPVGVDFDVEDKGSIVEVTFKDVLDLSEYSNKEVLGLIEGMNLTAVGFGKGLKLNNILQKEWQGFNFSGELDRPLGPNKVKLN